MTSFYSKNAIKICFINTSEKYQFILCLSYGSDYIYKPRSQHLFRCGSIYQHISGAINKFPDFFVLSFKIVVAIYLMR